MTDAPSCPECGAENVRFGYDEDADWMRCEDCDKIVEEWPCQKIPDGANGPETYQYQAKRRLS